MLHLPADLLILSKEVLQQLTDRGENDSVLASTKLQIHKCAQEKDPP